MSDNLEKKQSVKAKKEDDNRNFIYRPWITKNGQKIFAKAYGKKAFKIYID